MLNSKSLPQSLTPHRRLRSRSLPALARVLSFPRQSDLDQAAGRRWVLPLAYLALYVGWGTTYLAIRVGVQSLGPASFLGLRFLIAALALLPFLLIRGSFRGLSLRQISHSSLQGLLLLVGGLLPVAYAEKSVPSNVTAIVIGCAPVAFALFDRLLNGTPIRRQVVAGFVAGFLGVSLLGLGGRAGGTITSSGLALLILGFSNWSLASVLSKKLRPAASPVTHVFIQYVAAGAVLLAIALAAEGFGPSSLAARGPSLWQSLLYLALLPSLVSYTAYMWLLRVEPTSRVSTYAFVNPVVAVIAGALVLHESASPAVLSALALVILATWLNFLKPSR
jgi:drug/metabolite transporter (DMT)-like permease